MARSAMKQLRKKRGFTLIELIIFLGIFSAIIVSFIAILMSMLGLQTSQSAANEVNTQSQFVLQQLQYYISSARVVDMTQDVATSTIVLRESVSSSDPMYITVSGGSFYVQQGINNSLVALTSNKIFISNFSATRHYNISASSVPYGTDTVSYSFTMSATSTNNAPYARSFQSSVAVSNPVGKIALIQRARTDNNNPSVSSIAATYRTNNESSSLLLALVANTTSTSITVTDSASNTWKQTANIFYSAYNENLTLFRAPNAINSSNTVTATFGAGAGYASLFIYEYRGAVTSSSFDASSTQLQPNTQTPSSGSANPTSTVELVFSATYNGNTAEIPAAGAGFILESSSTVSHAFAEDSTQYITGPVAGTWQYTQTTPSSSVLVATFR